MILYIDTTEYESVTFAVEEDKKILKKTYRIDPHKSHETLAKLDEFLQSKKLQLTSVKKIIANKGPGSFTGTRVGVTHAQALGFALKVPVKFLDKANFSLP